MTSIEWLRQTYKVSGKLTDSDFEYAQKMVSEEKEKVLNNLPKAIKLTMECLKKEYPHSHIYETFNGRYGLESFSEHDQIDGIFDTYQEAVDFGITLLKQ